MAEQAHTTRRALFKAGALAIAPSYAASMVVYDPLLTLIMRYREGIAECDADPASEDDYDAVAQKTWHAPFKEICGWKWPAISAMGAAAAIRLAIEEVGSDAQEPMLRAAIGFLENV